MVIHLWQRLSCSIGLWGAVGFAVAAATTCTEPAVGEAADLLPCVGDCNGNQMVTVDELLTGVNIALGNVGIDRCASFDSNHDQGVTVDELVAGVNAALSGCQRPKGVLIGRVSSPRGSGFDIVPGAVVSVVDGPSTTTDDLGNFVLADVPAGERVVVNAAGPGERDPRTADIFGTTQVVVALANGEQRSVFPYLMRGCADVVNGATGGALSFDACGGAGRARLTFEPGSFATLDGHAFTEQVRVEVTAVDPHSVTQRAALPQHLLDDEEGRTPLQVWGDVEVRLFSAASRDPLRLAEGKSATTRIEVGATGDPLDAGQLRLRSYDDAAGTWRDEPAGTLVTEGDRVFYQFSASHFTIIVVMPGVPRTLDACLRVLITDPDPLGLHIEVAYFSVPPLLYTGPATVNCIPVYSNSAVYLHIVRPAGGSSVPLAEHWEPCDPTNGGCLPAIGTGPPTGPQALCQVAANCVLAMVPSLPSVQLSCLTGQFTRNGSNGAEPVTGPIELRQNGNVIATFLIPSSGCQDLCIPVPQVASDLELRDRGGNAVTFRPSGTPGAQCQSPAPCTHSGNCQELSPNPVPLICPGTGDCIYADFAYEVVSDPTCTDPAKPNRLRLNASSSTGPVHQYQWVVSRIDPPADTVQNPTWRRLCPGTDCQNPVALTDCLAPVLFDVYLFAIGNDPGTAPVKRRQIRAALGSPPCANGAASGQPCGDGNRVDGDGCSSQCVVEGCASGTREGLKDYQTYPHVAACGTLTDYLTAVAQAASTCQAGWHMCTLYSNDLDSIAASPKPAEPFTAWLQYDDVDCTFHEVFNVPACAGTHVMGSRFVHQAQYTRGCDGLGYCPEGYAPALYQSTWNYSARRQGSAVCAEHVLNLCGYAGGSDPVVPSYTACCRD